MLRDILQGAAVALACSVALGLAMDRFEPLSPADQAALRGAQQECAVVGNCHTCVSRTCQTVAGGCLETGAGSGGCLNTKSLREECVPSNGGTGCIENNAVGACGVPREPIACKSVPGGACASTSPGCTTGKDFDCDNCTSQ